ncbi:hypothetical protein KZC52_13310 [Microbacterium sp. kSW2-24]|uniref:hypothetical protein n=1 Tax=Microbacterium galbinum TaxID=2851646 RepID=UPI001FFD6474|nr:hypothetical protein [Microbacterium galbinum]MCK2023911.1 hypothetical protein [Microbacterium galbinum]
MSIVLVASALSGCAGMSAEEKVAVQEAQLKDFVAQADVWGGEIVAQIPVAEIEPAAESYNIGGVRKVSDYDDWPKYYYWDQIVELKAEGARAPSEVADDLEPWLEREGWERNEESEFPPGEQSFERDYYRDGYHLVVEVYTVPPPHAQKLAFMIVTPQTDPDRP